MPEKYNTVWTRAEWQLKRDKANVPKGAARLGISMGDALDKFHAAATAGPAKGLSAVPALRKTVDAYKKAVKTKYPAIHTQIETGLDHSIANYENDARGIIAAIRDYPTKRAAASVAMQQIGAEFVHAKEPGMLKTPNGKRAGKAVMDFYDVVKKMPYYSDKIKPADVRPYFQAAKWADDQKWNKATIDGLVRMLAKFPDKP